MKRLHTLIIIFLVLLNTSKATILTVKQDGTGNYTTIQSAINAAATGDTVLVWPGIYYENINYYSKGITVASLNLTTGDPAYIHSTIIDGNGNGSCIYATNIISPPATSHGFTLQNGTGSLINRAGGGVFLNECSFIIKNCNIINNIARSGGGICARNSDVFLTGTTIAFNVGLSSAGGVLVVSNHNFVFDPVSKNSVYLNHGANGCDVSKTFSDIGPPLLVVLDTGTVFYPDDHFFYSFTQYGVPVNDILWEIDHVKVQQVNSDLYVNPSGSNSNSGISVNEPLQSISYAIKKILPDTINPKTIYLSAGTFSGSVNNEPFPIIGRSYVSLTGLSDGNSIVDAESLFPLFFNNRSSHLKINNIMFKGGIDSQAVLKGVGGFEIGHSQGVHLCNVMILQTKGRTYSALFSNYANLFIGGTKILNNTGSLPVMLGNSGSDLKEIRVFNSTIKNNLPGESFEQGWGGAVGINGSLSYPNATYGRLVNVQITENELSFEPGAGTKAICGLSCYGHARVDVVNTTIGNNEIVNPVDNAQVIAQEGAQINFYNSIIHGVEDYEIFLGDGQPTSYISTINISNSNVKGGEGNIQNWNNIHNLNWFSGNIADDPMWSGSEPHYYDLLEGSPSINTGTPMYEPGMDYPFIKTEGGKHILYTLTGDTIHLPATDLAGNPRISGGRIDMGAYEFQETTTNQNIYGQTPKHGFRVHPNPFVSNAFISFKTAREHQVTINVINMKGETMRTIASNRFPTGEYRLIFDGHDDAGFTLDPGTYLVCLYLDGILAGSEKLVRAKR